MKISIPENKHLVCRSQFPVRWGELDAYAHVNSCTCFKYMETIRLDWQQSIGIPVTPSEFGIVVGTSFCTYHRQIRFPDLIDMAMYVSDVREKSFETWYVMRRVEEPDAILAEGGATMIWIKSETGRSHALPKWLLPQLLRPA